MVIVVASVLLAVAIPTILFTDFDGDGKGMNR